MSTNKSSWSNISKKNKFIENEHKHEINILKTEAGFLGKFWGTKFAINNIAGFICISGIVLLAAVFFLNLSESTLSNMIQTLSSLITLCLGYMFGNKFKNSE
jgi:hypothetical protein